MAPMTIPHRHQQQRGAAAGADDVLSSLAERFTLLLTERLTQLEGQLIERITESLSKRITLLEGHMTDRITEQEGHLTEVTTLLRQLVNATDTGDTAPLSILEPQPIQEEEEDQSPTAVNAALDAHVNLVRASVQQNLQTTSIEERRSEPILELSWSALRSRFPKASFMAEGGTKKVYKVYYSSGVQQEDAVSVMYVVDPFEAFTHRPHVPFTH
jgi:hypothetical protein